MDDDHGSCKDPIEGGLLRCYIRKHGRESAGQRTAERDPEQGDLDGLRLEDVML
jgi:hypothetical protein